MGNTQVIRTSNPDRYRGLLETAPPSHMYHRSEVFGENLVATLNRELGNNWTVLDSNPDQELEKEVDTLKAHLIELLELGHYEPIVEFLGSRQISMTRIDQGGVLPDRYFDALPSPLYKLIGVVWDTANEGDDSEPPTTIDDIAQAIRDIPIPQFARLCNNYWDKLQDDKTRFIAIIENYQKIITDRGQMGKLFDYILTGDEIDQLVKTTEIRLQEVQVHLQDRLIDRDGLTYSGAFTGFDNRYGSPNESIHLFMRPTLQPDSRKEENTKTVIHEHNHIALSRGTILQDTERGVNKTVINGLRYYKTLEVNETKISNVWIDEAVTTLLEAYIYDRIENNENSAMLDPDYLAQLLERTDTPYPEEIKVLHKLVSEGVLNLQETLRLYFGFPPITASASNSREVNLGKFSRDLNQELKSRYGLRTIDLDRLSTSGEWIKPEYLFALAEEYLAQKNPDDMEFYKLLDRDGLDAIATSLLSEQLRDFVEKYGHLLTYGSEENLSASAAFYHRRDIMVFAEIMKELDSSSAQEWERNNDFIDLAILVPNIDEATRDTSATVAESDNNRLLRIMNFMRQNNFNIDLIEEELKTETAR